MKLHGYFRSSVAYRVRIALNLKGLRVEHLTPHLRKGEQHDRAIWRSIRKPWCQTEEGDVLIQSLAIIEYLEETRPGPALLLRDPVRRAKVRGFSHAIASDTHPLQNLTVHSRLRQDGVFRGKGRGMGRLGESKGDRRVRKADRRGGRPVLLRTCSNDSGYLPRPAAVQRAAVWRGCGGLSAPAAGGGCRQGAGGLCRCGAGAPERRRIVRRGTAGYGTGSVTTGGTSQVGLRRRQDLPKS